MRNLIVNQVGRHGPDQEIKVIMKKIVQIQSRFGIFELYDGPQKEIKNISKYKNQQSTGERPAKFQQRFAPVHIPEDGQGTTNRNGTGEKNDHAAKLITSACRAQPFDYSYDGCYCIHYTII